MVKSILFVVSEKGYTWDEVIVPFNEFRGSGYDVKIATPTGRVPRADPLSIIVRPMLNFFGFGTSKSFSPLSIRGKELSNLLESPLPLERIDSRKYQAMYVAGGHGSLFDLNKNAVLHRLILDFEKENKPVGLICHAVSTLAFITKNGKPFLHNRKVTGFPTLWEKILLLIHYIHPAFLPLPLWTGRELDKYPTGRTVWIRIQEAVNPMYTIQDGILVTGVGPKAGGEVAKRMLALL